MSEGVEETSKKCPVASGRYFDRQMHPHPEHSTPDLSLHGKTMRGKLTRMEIENPARTMLESMSLSTLPSMSSPLKVTNPHTPI